MIEYKYNPTIQPADPAYVEFFNNLKSTLESYFTNVTYDGTQTITCYNGEAVFLILGGGSNKNEIIVNYPDTTHYAGIDLGQFNISSYHSCNNGIMVAFSPTPQYNFNTRSVLFITKDSNDNTTILLCDKTPQANNINNPRYYVINQNTQYYANNMGLSTACITFNSDNITADRFNIGRSTTFTNVPTNEEGVYCPNAYVLLTIESTLLSPSTKIIRYNNHNYITNGMIAILDE